MVAKCSVMMGGATGVAQTAVWVLRTEIWQRWEQLAPSRGLHPALGACRLLGRLRRPALSPHLAFFCGKCAHGIGETLAHVPGRKAAPCAARSSPDGCSADALDNQPAEPAGTAPEPPPVVAKCSVMMGGQLVSRRRLFGCSGPKSGSAESSWRPQHTRKFSRCAHHDTCAPK